MSTIIGNRIFGNAPFVPLTWPLGGFPTIGEDIPIMAVFVFLFLLAAGIHMLLFIMSLFRAHRFLISFLLFFFCLERIMALILRISGTIYGDNGYLYIAGVLMIYAGTPLLYLVNLMFAHRLIRAQHPLIGMISTLFFFFIYFLMFITWGMLVSGLIQPFFRSQGWVRDIDRSLRIYGFTFYAFIALLPILLVGVSSCIPRAHRANKFGAGSMYAKVWILVLACILSALEAFYIAGAEWMTPESRFGPQPDWMARPWYYVMIWLIEFIIVLLYALGRVDQRFHTTPAEGTSAHHYAGMTGGYGPSGAAAVGPGGEPPRKGRLGRFGKLALGAGAGAAGAAALHHHHNRNRGEKGMVDDDIERTASPEFRDDSGPPQLEPLAAHRPYKEVRGFDAETIPEESESEDSLYAAGSSIETESKRNSAVLAHEQDLKHHDGHGIAV